MDADRLLAEVLYNIFSHICRYADDVHEFHIIVTFRMFHAAYACSVAVYESKDMELLVLCVLLAHLLELEAAERDVHLRVLAEDVLLPAFSLCVAMVFVSRKTLEKRKDKEIKTKYINKYTF